MNSPSSPASPSNPLRNAQRVSLDKKPHLLTEEKEATGVGVGKSMMQEFLARKSSSPEVTHAVLSQSDNVTMHHGRLSLISSDTQSFRLPDSSVACMADNLLAAFDPKDPVKEKALGKSGRRSSEPNVSSTLSKSASGELVAYINCTRSYMWAGAQVERV